MADIRA